MAKKTKKSSKTSKSSLGSGLSALIDSDSVDSLDQAYIPNLDINLISANPYQPRIEMNPEELVELADSIREHGVIEPLIVTKEGPDKFNLIAGERRWRASKLAKLKTLPVVVKEASPQQVLELAVVENIQRADLNALEEGMAFDQLIQKFKLTHAEVATKVGLSRPAIANKIRLLKLPNEVKKGLLEHRIEEGHARALLGLASDDAMIATYKIIVRDGLSVRAVEELVRRLNQGHKKQRKATDRIIDDYTRETESSLREKFGKQTRLFRSKKGGKIVIPFKNDKELEKLKKQMQL